MNKNPLISIITPSFNQGEYIEDTIKSVVSQNYPNIEYIIVDGSSTDETLDILKKYKKKIRWISEKDNGQADAVNKGIKLTKGEIVAWLNSDDILLPDAVNRIANFFSRNHEVMMVYGKCYYIDQVGEIIGKYPTEEFSFEKLARFNFISQPSTFFKRNAFYDVGGLNSGLHYSLDYDLWIRISARFKVKYLSEFLSGYRLHETSKTVAYSQALSNHKEGLNTALRYYNWAPANRVYGYCYHIIEPKLPMTIRKFRLL